MIQTTVTSVDPGGVLFIQPPIDKEWIVLSVTHEYDAELIHVEGTNEITIDSDTGAGAWIGLKIGVTNTCYLKVKNLDTVNARLIGYSAIEL